MSKLDKIKNLSLLFDTYKELLTDNQREAFIMYYLEDSSLSEIADTLKVSKPSVSDNLKKTEEKLIKYETKLKLAERNEKINNLIKDIENTNIQKKIKELL